MKLYLASASPRRRELLEYMGIPFETAVSDAAEDASGTPEEAAVGNAVKKGEAVSRLHPGDVVLAADTVVCLDDGRILGKPRSREEAFGMLRALSGAAHRVVTGVAVFSPFGVKTGFEVSRVVLTPLRTRRSGITSPPVSRWTRRARMPCRGAPACMSKGWRAALRTSSACRRPWSVGF